MGFCEFRGVTVGNGFRQNKQTKKERFGIRLKFLVVCFSIDIYTTMYFKLNVLYKGVVQACK